MVAKKRNNDNKYKKIGYDFTATDHNFTPNLNPNGLRTVVVRRGLLPSGVVRCDPLRSVAVNSYTVVNYIRRGLL